MLLNKLCNPPPPFLAAPKVKLQAAWMVISLHSFEENPEGGRGFGGELSKGSCARKPPYSYSRGCQLPVEKVLEIRQQSLREGGVHRIES